jgi:hypothetical protein
MNEFKGRLLRYKNGYPYSNPLPSNIKSACRFIIKKKENCGIIIDGPPGRGKTTFACEIADQINAEFGQPEIDLLPENHPQLGMGLIQFQKNLGICQEKGYHVLIYDEAGDYDRKNAMSKLNKYLNETWDTFRQFKIIPILCLPRFYRLDTPIFDNEIPKLLLHCKAKHDGYIDFKAFDFEGMAWLLHWRKKNKLPGWRVYGYTEPIFEGHFLRLSEERERLLDALSLKGKKDKNKAARIQAEGLVSIKDLAEKLNRSSVWVRKQIVKGKFNPEDIIGGKNYYKGVLLSILEKRKVRR